MGIDDDVNLYAYVKNDPLNRTDPTGTDAVCAYITGCNVVVTEEGVREIAGFIPGSGFVEAAEAAEAASNERYGVAAVTVGMEVSGGKYVKKALGVVYRMLGKFTKSGKDYIGRTKTGNPSTRGNDGGRVRNEETEIVDTYDPADVAEGAYKEQRAIDKDGGVGNLDNKRREASSERMQKLEGKYGDQKTVCTGSRIARDGPC